METLLLTIEEAAQLVGIGRDSAYACVKSGEWPSVKIGKRKMLISRAFLYEKYGKPQTEASDV